MTCFQESLLVGAGFENGPKVSWAYQLAGLQAFMVPALLTPQL